LYDSIHFPTVGMDPSECDQTEATIRQELDFTTTFSQITHYRWQNEQLALFTDADEVLIFEPFSTATQQNSPVVSAPTATALLMIPAPIANSPIQLGLPQNLGRGQIVNAAFTPDGTGVAIAWAHGVSFTAVAAAHKQWFQPLLANSVAIDKRRDGQEVAVAP
jgi:hypothetical protein